MIMGCPQGQSTAEISFCGIDDLVDRGPLSGIPREQAMKVRGLGLSDWILIAATDPGDRSTYWQGLLSPTQTDLEYGGCEQCAHVHWRRSRAGRKGASQPLQPLSMHPRRHPGPPRRNGRAKGSLWQVGERMSHCDTQVLL